MLFISTFYSSKKPKKIYKMYHGSKSAYYYDFWRSCDTEDWSNDAENTAFIKGKTYILSYMHIENSYFKL